LKVPEEGEMEKGGACVDLDKRPIKVVVVDDHEIVRAGLLAMFSHEADIDVVGAFADAESAIANLDALEPDVVVLDFRLPGLSGAMACAEIVERRPSTKVLMLTSIIHDSVAYSCLRAGAHGFLIKNADTTDLVAGVRSVAEGQAVVAPEALDSLLRWARGFRPGTEDTERLKPQEIAVLSLAARGMKNREISRRLKVTETAVKTFLNGARKKLGARDRSEAVLIGIRSGVI
jgi:DNA-binding NarL/FixJ family response regulator